MEQVSIINNRRTFKVPFNTKPSSIISWLAILLALFEVLRMVGFVSYEPNQFLLVGLMLLTVVNSLFNSNAKVNLGYILFFIYLCINIIITSPAAIFNPWGRMILLFILFSCVSPMFENKSLILFRQKCFFTILKIGAVLSVLSCLCYFLGINYFVNNYGQSDFVSRTGLFGGLFKHSMFLGPIAGISTCFLIWTYLRNRKKYILVLCILALGATFFSASRAAVTSTITGSVILLFVFYKNKGKAIKNLIFVSVVLFITSPFWSFSLDGINKKNYNDERGGGKYGSRTEKVDARLEEFKSSPIFGVGFASINPNGKDVFNYATGQIEPGSSWLCTLSMTGIIGFLFVAYFMIVALIATRKSKAPTAPLMFSLTVWFAVHMTFEGYIYGAGGPLCFIYWLAIGVSTDQKFIE